MRTPTMSCRLSCHVRSFSRHSVVLEKGDTTIEISYYDRSVFLSMLLCVCRQGIDATK
jgi:hypothetical protein